MQEIWKDVKGFEDRYRVSNLGKVWSKTSDRELKPYIINSGYQVVTLQRNGIKVKYQVHRLVAIHFCEGCRRDLVVNHIDGDRLNNQSANLEWVSQRDNVGDMKRRGTLNVEMAHKAAWKNNQKSIALIHPDGTEEVFESTKICASKYNLIPSKITDVLKGRRTHHKGFKARYIG